MYENWNITYKPNYQYLDKKLNIYLLNTPA
jgi:hypothetical protein